MISRAAFFVLYQSSFLQFFNHTSVRANELYLKAL